MVKLVNCGKLREIEGNEKSEKCRKHGKRGEVYYFPTISKYNEPTVRN